MCLAMCMHWISEEGYSQAKVTAICAASIYAELDITTVIQISKTSTYSPWIGFKKCEI